MTSPQYPFKAASHKNSVIPARPTRRLSRFLMRYGRYGLHTLLLLLSLHAPAGLHASENRATPPSTGTPVTEISPPPTIRQNALLTAVPDTQITDASWDSSDDWGITSLGIIIFLLLVGYARLLYSKNLLIREDFRRQEAERRLFSKGPVVVITWKPDPGWPVISASANINKVLGISRKRLLEQNFRFLDLLHPEETARFEQVIYSNLLEKKYQWQHIYRIHDDQGHTRWISSITMAEKDETENITCLRGYLLDITTRLALEERLKLLASVFEYAQESIAITDSDSRILEVNPSFCATTGFTQEEVSGQNLTRLGDSRYSPGFYSNIGDILAREGHWQGEIYLQRKNGEVYPGQLSLTAVVDHQGNLLHHIAVFADLSHLKWQELKIQRLAHYDGLTGLPNRVLLVDRLHMAMAEAYRESTQIVIACLDLDGFKLINETYGHALGDTLLTQTGQRLTAMLRETDTVARLGGDEFVIVLGGGTEQHKLLERLNGIMRRISDPFELPEITLSLSASTGITFFPSDDADPDTLLRHADQAMYRAKQAGRNRIHIFEVREESVLRQRMHSRERFRKALEQGELLLHYQPKVDMQKGLVMGVEALVRWQNPEEGLLFPGSFLPTIENTDLELRLGEWVISTALAQASFWHRQGLKLAVSVNIASPHILSPKFLPYLSYKLKEYAHLPARTLEIELLESAALADLDEVARVLESCRTLGVGIALDDFGTGYSSLAHLRRLPADQIKVDQSFVRNMEHSAADLAIVESVVGLAQVFKRQIIAEGVETATHGLMLLHMGCTFAQGYGIAKPMPAHDIQDWITTWKPEKSWLTAKTLEHSFPFC